MQKARKLPFLIRTEQVKTKIWRRKHGQPLESSEVNEVWCRCCKGKPETVLHLLDDDPKDGELYLSRVKPGGTLVEARSDTDVQIVRQTWV